MGGEVDFDVRTGSTQLWTTKVMYFECQIIIVCPKLQHNTHADEDHWPDSYMDHRHDNHPPVMMGNDAISVMQTGQKSDEKNPQAQNHLSRFLSHKRSPQQNESQYADDGYIQTWSKGDGMVQTLASRYAAQDP